MGSAGGPYEHTADDKPASPETLTQLQAKFLGPIRCQRSTPARESNTSSEQSPNSAMARPPAYGSLVDQLAIPSQIIPPTPASKASATGMTSSRSSLL